MRRLLKKKIKQIVSPYPYRYYYQRKKVIFIHIPKSAGTSVLSMLGTHISRDHATWYEFRASDVDRFESYYKFSVVRNPYSRLISTFRYLSRGGNQVSDMRWLQMPLARCSTFNDFVDKCLSEELVYGSRMFWPQHMFLFNEFGDLMVDRVLKFENLSRDWSDLASRIGAPKELKRLNMSGGASSSHDLPSDVKQKIFSLYKRDFELLGYIGLDP